MPNLNVEKVLGEQQGYVYIHEMEILTQRPMHFKLHAILLHHTPFYVSGTLMRTSFATLDIRLPILKNAAYALKEALPRFTMVEAEVWVTQLKLLSTCKENGIPRTYGELIGIEEAVMKCRV